MTIDTKDSDDKLGSSRRSVLKAGVAIGVGAVAWSGPTITSLGGTPAYAVVCTQNAKIFTLVNDTNTNSSCTVGGFTYLTFQANLSVTVPPEYNLNLSQVLGACSNLPRTFTFTDPPGEKCQLQFTVYSSNGKVLGGTLANGTSSYTSSTLCCSGTTPTIAKAQNNPQDLTANLIVGADGRYSISLVCIPTTGACFPNGQPF